MKMTKKNRLLLTFLGAVASSTALASVQSERSAGGAVIRFAVPKGDAYRDKVDFAALDGDPRYAIPPAALEALTPESIADWSQEELDQLYARLHSGPIPDGAFKGSIILSPGGGMKQILDSMSKSGKWSFVHDHPALAATARLLGFNADRGDEDAIRLIGEAMWHGKVFYRKDKVLRNLISPWNLKVLSAFAFGQLGLVFRGPHTDPDPAIQKGAFGHDEKRLFPAKLYCGQSILDARRESVIIDYAYTDTVPGYAEAAKLNFIASRKALGIRDEIRMVHPGFYLGRAYGAKAFLLNFTLYNPQFTQKDDDCWPNRDEKI